MSNRKKITYESVYRYMHENLNITHGLRCKSYMADYEVALTDAFSTIVPEAEISHCLFHFDQACKRNAAKCTAMQNFFDA